MIVPYMRRKKILALLAEREVMSVSDISQLLGISISTARRDMNCLLSDDLVEKKRGGAFCIKAKPNQSNINSIAPPVDHTESGPKTLIAQKAAKLVNDGDIIFVDSGTTAGKMVQFITAKKVTVVTTSINLVTKYLPEEGISCFLLGGEYFHELESVNGPLTEAQISSMHFDKAFLGANAYSLEEGCTYVYDIREANIKQLVKSHSAVTYLLAETYKQSKIVFFKAFDLKDCIIINELPDNAGTAFSNL